MDKHVAILAGFLLGAVCIGQASAAINLLINGGFETGDFTGWTQEGNLGFTGVTTFPVHSGIYAACFGPMGSDGGIVQVLNTVVGQTYDLSFWLYNEGGTPNAVIVSWGGTVVFNESDLSSFPYTQFNYSTVATSTTTPLELEFRQDPAYFYLDDVSVTAVPEPTTLVNLSLLGGCGLAVNRWRKPKAA